MRCHRIAVIILSLAAGLVLAAVPSLAVSPAEEAVTAAGAPAARDGRFDAAPPPQREAVRMTVSPAYGGYFKYGEWLPLRVALANQGADLNGELRATITAGSNKTTYATAAPLAAQANKEVILYIQPPSFLTSITVELLQDGRVVTLAETELHALSNGRYVVGLVAPDAGPYGLLDGLELRETARTVKLVPLALQDLPERAEALRTFDALVLADTDTAGLTPGQTGALDAWIANGGRLILAGGPGAGRTLAGLPASLRPASVARLESDAGMPESLAAFAGVSWSAAPQELVLAAPADRFGSSLLEGKGAPLIQEKRSGKGRIDYLAFDPGLAPFAAWAGMRGAWARLLAPGSAYPTNLPPDSSESQMAALRFSNALTNLPSLDLPSMRWLAVLLGIYIVMVGPANYWVLRRMRRMEWAWFSIPLLTLVFAGGAFGMGYGLRGSDVILNQASVVKVPGKGVPALVRSYVGIFSPGRTPYNLVVEGSAAVGPLVTEPNRFGGYLSNAGNLTIVQGEPTLLRDVFINQWSMVGFQAERYTPASEWRLASDLRFDGQRVLGTLGNETAYDLSDVVVVLGTRYARVGDVKAGETLAVDAALESTNNSGIPFPYVLFQRDMATGGMGKAARAAALKQNLLEGVFDPNSSTDLSADGMVVFGWFGDSPIRVHLAEGEAGHQHTSVLVTALPLEFNRDGRIVLPPGLLVPHILDMRSKAGICGPNGRIFLDMEGEATLEYRLPSSLAGARIVRLGITTSVDNVQAALPGAALYDWDAAQWVELSGMTSSGDHDVPEPARYVDRGTGTLQLRLAPANGQGGGCYQYDLTVEAEASGAAGSAATGGQP